MRTEPSVDDSWVTGDQFGIPIPAHPAALRAAGVSFLTSTFHASGVLEANNCVTRITQFQEVPGGSTGRKLLLSVEYDRPDPLLRTELFAKFSRDLGNAIRDRGKTQMEPEVRFASLARALEFPIAVPSPQFGDYHRETGIRHTDH